MSSKPSLPASWTFDKTSSNPAVYPPDTDFEIAETAAGLYRIAWGERWLDGLGHVKIGEVEALDGAGASASDLVAYDVKIRFDPPGQHLEATVSPSNGNDPGDLAGTWGADVKRMAAS
jgi:hypothetical protein